MRYLIQGKYLSPTLVWISKSLSILGFHPDSDTVCLIQKIFLCLVKELYPYNSASKH